MIISNLFYLPIFSSPWPNRSLWYFWQLRFALIHTWLLEIILFLFNLWIFLFLSHYLELMIFVYKSVIDGQTPMMWWQSCQIRFSSLPQKVVQFYWDHLFTLFLQVLLHLLYSHHWTGSKLCLFIPVRDLFLALYLFPEMFAVLKYSLGLKDLRHPVIWKHSQLIDIVELSQTFAFEFAVDISY